MVNYKRLGVAVEAVEPTAQCTDPEVIACVLVDDTDEIVAQAGVAQTPRIARVMPDVPKRGGMRVYLADAPIGRYFYVMRDSYFFALDLYDTYRYHKETLSTRFITCTP